MMDNSNLSIGARIRQLRKSHKLTQRQLGDLTGVTNKHISELERGITGLSIDLQSDLHNTLHCSLDYLILGVEYESIASRLPNEIVELLRSDDMEEIDVFMDYVKLYLKHKKKR